jgi:hypothetical protein
MVDVISNKLSKEDNQKMISSRMTKEEYEKNEQEQHKKDQPEDYEKAETYLTSEFKRYVSDKYPVENGDHLFQNP